MGLRSGQAKEEHCWHSVLSGCPSIYLPVQRPPEEHRSDPSSCSQFRPRTTGSNSLPKPARHNSLLWFLQTQKPPAPEITQQGQRGRCPPHSWPSPTRLPPSPLVPDRAPALPTPAAPSLLASPPAPTVGLGHGGLRHAEAPRPPPGPGRALPPGREGRGRAPPRLAPPRPASPRLSSARNGHNGPAAHAPSAPRHGGRAPPQ